ncbi:MAG TPA: serine hydrolase domain-containing protein [Vicinamibacteria bacterium]|nr:serine hydrolase domain-containing protein [Vicinamibacteria bacterium]
MRSRKLAPLTALLVHVSLVGPGAADEVDRYVEARMRTMRIPGLSLLVVRDGQVVKSKGYGYADLQHRVPATPGTVYEIGSNGKQFTAVAVLMLAEEGKLRLDDPVAKYFPGAPEFWQRITLAHLLGHTGGIQNHVAVPGYLGAFRTNLFFEGTPAPDELLKKFFELPKEFEPGQTWAYDNTGFILLGWVIEKVSGMPYWHFMEERIFRPLGMTATRSTDPRPIVPGRAVGYGWVNGAFENRAVLWPHVAFSAGSLLSTVGDLAKWDAALGTERLLRADSWARAWTAAKAPDGTPLPFDYGLGWFVESQKGRRYVSHGGGTPGFSSAIHRLVDDRLLVVILTNHSDMLTDTLALDIAAIFEPRLRRPSAPRDSDPATTAAHRAVFADLLAGRHDPARFTPPMALFLSTATGKSFGQWFAEHGEMRSFAFEDEERRGDHRFRRYGVVLGETRYGFSFLVAPDGRIAAVRWW